MKFVLLLALAAAGCHSSKVSATGPLVALADSVRWVQEEAYQPYALTWRPQATMNLWVRMDSRCSSPSFPYPSDRYQYSVVYVAKLPPLWLALGDTAKGVVCGR